MTEVKQKNFTDDLKTKVTFEAIRGIKTMNKNGQEFGMHPTQVDLWKKELQEQKSNLFETKHGVKPINPSESSERLYSKIGRYEDRMRLA